MSSCLSDVIRIFNDRDTINFVCISEAFCKYDDFVHLKAYSRQNLLKVCRKKCFFRAFDKTVIKAR